MNRPILTSAPAEPPVTLAEAKAHLRVDGSDEDTLITSIVSAVTSHLDGWTGILGRCIVTQTWTFSLDGWASRIGLPFPDVSGVEITYRDSDDTEQTVSTSLYDTVEGPRGAVLVFKDGFTSPSLYDDRAAPISVAVTAGYGGADAVPEALKQAILLMVGHYFENRTAVSEGGLREVPMAFEALTTPYRSRWV